MAIGTYAELQTAVTAYLTLDTATVAMLPTFIQLAEAELGRLLTTPDRDGLMTASTVAGTQAMALPAGFKQVRAVLIADDYPLALVPLDALLSGNRDGVRGEPRNYCIANQQLYLSPVPDAVYTISLFYAAVLPALSATSTTNWLLTSNPDAYLFATIYQAEAYLVNDERAAHAQSVMGGLVNQINAQGNRARHGGAVRLRSPVCV